MRWFKHDSDANTDAKLIKVRHKYGMVGYGLYWYCLELIARNVNRKNVTFELEHDSESIALEWNLDQVKVQEMMEYMVDLGLFENQDGRITCLKLAFRIDDTNAKTPEIREIQEGIREGSKSLGETPNNSELLGESPTNSGQIRRDKKRKELSSKPDDGLDFESFWRTYPRKESKKKAEKAWNRLSKTKRRKAIQDTATRYRHTEKRFIPLPPTYLNGERWEDERPSDKQGGGEQDQQAVF